MQYEQAYTRCGHGKTTPGVCRFYHFYFVTAEHRSMTNYIEAILLKHINESETCSAFASHAAGDRKGRPYK